MDINKNIIFGVIFILFILTAYLLYKYNEIISSISYQDSNFHSYRSDPIRTHEPLDNSVTEQRVYQLIEQNNQQNYQGHYNSHALFREMGFEYDNSTDKFIFNKEVVFNNPVVYNNSVS